MRNLHRLGRQPDRIEVNELAVEFGPSSVQIAFIARIGSRIRSPPQLRLDASVAHLPDRPPRARTEQEAPAGQMIDCCDLLGHDDRITLGNDAYPGAQPEPRGDRRGTPSALLAAEAECCNDSPLPHAATESQKWHRHALVVVAPLGP